MKIQINNYYRGWKRGWLVFKPISMFFEIHRSDATGKITFELFFCLLNIELNIWKV